MKSLYVSIFLFFGVVSALWANSIYIKQLVKNTNELFEEIPDDIYKVDNMTQKNQQKALEDIEKILKLWKRKKLYLCSILDHNMYRQFTGEIETAKAFFEAQEYPEFLSYIISAKDSLLHIKQDEEIFLGNIL